MSMSERERECVCVCVCNGDVLKSKIIASQQRKADARRGSHRICEAPRVEPCPGGGQSVQCWDNHGQLSLPADLPQTHSARMIWISTAQQEYRVSHTSNLKVAGSHMKKETKGEIKFNKILHLPNTFKVLSSQM